MTPEQLADLTEFINTRFAEFGAGFFAPLSVGQVRVVNDAIDDWWRATDSPSVAWAVPAEQADTKRGAEVAAIDGAPFAEVGEIVYEKVPTVATNGNHLDEQVVVKPRTLAQMDAAIKRVDERAAELQEVIAALKAMAKGGNMPTLMRWDDDKPSHLHGGSTLLKRHGLASWHDLAAKARLRVGGRGRQGDAAREERERATVPTLDELVAEVKRQAMGGVMPSQAAFNAAKPAVWATATAHTTRLGVSWEALAQEAGLKPSRTAS